jgi:hypothetical protein
MKLYVKESMVGEYSVSMTSWEIDLKQKIYLTNGDDIVQNIYFYPAWGEFFTIYGYVTECGDIDFYLIDSRNINEDDKEYHAIKVPEETDAMKLAIKLMHEDW